MKVLNIATEVTHEGLLKLVLWAEDFRQMQNGATCFLQEPFVTQESSVAVHVILHAEEFEDIAVALDALHAHLMHSSPCATSNYEVMFKVPPEENVQFCKTFKASFASMHVELEFAGVKDTWLWKVIIKRATSLRQVFALWKHLPNTA